MKLIEKTKILKNNKDDDDDDEGSNAAELVRSPKKK